MRPNCPSCYPFSLRHESQSPCQPLLWKGKMGRGARREADFHVCLEPHLRKGTRAQGQDPYLCLILIGHLGPPMPYQMEYSRPQPYPL